jgi:hypothetical protein
MEVQLCSHICHVPLARFTEKVKAFDAQLGPPNGNGKHKAALKGFVRSRRKNVLADAENAAGNLRSTLHSHTDLLRQILQLVNPAPMMSVPSLCTIDQRSSPSDGYRVPSSRFDIELASSFDPLAHQVYSMLASVHRTLSEIMLIPFSLLPQVNRDLSLLQPITRAPTLLLSDNIQLEDALGRRMSLPFEHF